MGIIAIPGMMTGAILGGSSVQQAARLQMVIMFMIAASGALASMAVTVMALGVIVDGEHRVRPDRIDARAHAIWRGRNWVIGKMKEGVKDVGEKILRLVGRGKEKEGENGTSERDGLLG